MDRTDILRISQTILVPILSEIYGYRDLRNLDYTDQRNYPSVDLGDDYSRIAIQVTASRDAEKIKETLRRFIKHGLYDKYERLVIYIISEKQASYSGRGFEETLQGKFHFDKDADIWDYRDVLKAVSGLPLEQVRKVEQILEANFGGLHGTKNRAESAAVHLKLGNYLVALDLYSQELQVHPQAQLFIGRAKCYVQLALEARRVAEKWRVGRLDRKPSATVAQTKYAEESDRARKYADQAYKDFSDAIALAESPEIAYLPRTLRLHMQAFPLEYRPFDRWREMGNNDWEEDIAWLHEYLKEQESGEALYLEALSYSWDSYLFGMGRCKIANWQVKALACLNRAIELGYAFPEVYFLRAQAHHWNNNFGLALKDIDEVCKTDSSMLRYEAMCIKIAILTKIHRYDEAYEVCRSLEYKIGRVKNYFDVMFGVDEMLLCGYALTAAYGPDEPEITLQVSGEDVEVSFAWNSSLEERHPKTIALLKKLLGNTSQEK